MIGPIYSQEALVSILQTAIASGGTLAGAKIGLYEDEAPILPTTDIASLTPAGYGGYAPSPAVVWQTPHVSLSGIAVVQCAPHEFKPTDASSNGTVRVVVLQNAAGDKIIAHYRLDTPIVMGNPNDVVLIGFPAMMTQPAEALENIVP